MRLWLGVCVAAVAAVAATGASGGSVASHATSSASGQCSKAEAIDAVKRLGLTDISPTYPVYKVLCGAFTGAGSKTMVVSLGGDGASTGMLYWTVFRWTGTEWQFLMKQRQAAVLTAAGSDIRETVSIYRDGDPRCCPSGGTRARIWHWNGSRFVAGPWKHAGDGVPKRRGFYSPSRNIACGMFDDSSYRYVNCQSRVPPQNVTMDASGRVTICRDRTPNVNNDCNLGDPGEGVIPVLAYGRQITVGRFRCLSLQIGIRCTVIQSGKGFLINRDGVSRIGP